MPEVALPAWRGIIERGKGWRAQYRALGANQCKRTVICRGKDWLILVLATLILTPVSLLLAYVVLYAVTSLPLS
jgi:hypothetical protein